MNDNIGIYNHETGEQTVRAMTDLEVSERKELATDAKAKSKADEAAAEAAATQKAALLARLGITADEAKLLIG